MYVKAGWHFDGEKIYVNGTLKASKAVKSPGVNEWLNP
jgi:hypothetical protein